MAVPRLTHLQFLILGCVLDGESSGKALRATLRRAGVRRSGPSFYQLMARLEDSGFVTGRYEQEIVDGQIIRERCYTLTVSGRRAWRECRDFYARWSTQPGAAPA